MRYQSDPQFSKELRRHMGRLKCGVADLAVMLKVSESTLYKWLRGKSPHPLMQQGVLIFLADESLQAYSPKEIVKMLKTLRRQENFGKEDKPP